MATGDHLIDTLFDGRYLITRKLGSGGMANVYLAQDQELGRRVAIKILDDRHASDEQFVERFRREAQNAAGLSHPNIVSIYDRGESEGTYYIAMEYVEGRTLKELIVARGPSPIGIAIDYTRQILSALRFAHRNGIVHRDIKPHNVIVDGDGRVKVMDFGIARAGAASQMTEAGSIIGTAQYLSPEQARGAPVDQTSDLYSTGIVLYELLTGSVPFTGETPVEIAMKHLSQTPDPPSTHRPEVPRDLDYVVLRALAKDPADRYHSAEEMDSDLERIARGIGVSAETAEAATSVLSRTEVGEAATTIGPAAAASTTYTPGRYYEYDEPPRRRSIWPWLLGALLVAAVLVGGWFAYQAAAGSAERDEAGGRARRRRASRSSSPCRTIRDAGLKELVRREPNADVEAGSSSSRTRSRASGSSAATSSRSSSRPASRRRCVPNVVGQSRDEAVADARRTPSCRRTSSRSTRSKPVNTVLATAPKAGHRVVEGTTVRVNVSKGPKPVTVPNVVGSRLRERRVGAPGPRLRGRAGGRRGRRRRRDRRRPEPRRRHAAGEGLDDHAAGLRGPADLAGPRRHEPDRGRRARPAASSPASRSQVVEEIVDDESLDGSCSRRIPRAAPTPSRARRW